MNNLAWLLAENGGNLDEALDLARTANEKLPNNAAILDTIGWVYYKKGIYSSAVEQLNQCVEKFPRVAPCQYHLGFSYFKSGSREKAKLLLNQALRLDPAFSGVAEAQSILASLK